jgi:hypothetical protein
MPFRGKKEKSGGMLLFAQPKSGMSLGLKLSNISNVKASFRNRQPIPDNRNPFVNELTYVARSIASIIGKTADLFRNRLEDRNP